MTRPKKAERYKWTARKRRKEKINEKTDARPSKIWDNNLSVRKFECVGRTIRMCIVKSG